MSAHFAGAEVGYSEVRVVAAGEPIDSWADEPECYAPDEGVAVVFDTADDDHLILTGSAADIRLLLFDVIDQLSAAEPPVGSAVTSPAVDG